MSPITVELLKKRSEHNDGLLSELQEISLHQEEIDCIPKLLATCCPNLRILYLQNNIISRMEYLNRLKSLIYLNIAINNIKIVENIDRCFSLKKLDLTLNFINCSFVDSVTCMSKLPNLEDLYLMGNPCMDIKDSRFYIVNRLQSLKQLDGNLIGHIERRNATIRMNEILKEKSLNNIISTDNIKILVDSYICEQISNTMNNNNNNEININNKIQERVDLYREISKQKMEAEDKKRNLFDFNKIDKIVNNKNVKNSKGGIRQCNEPNYDFRLIIKNKETRLEIDTPRHLLTEFMDVDINPLYVRLVVKGKLFQLKLDEEILVSLSSVKRSETTGGLLIIMPLLIVKRSSVLNSRTREHDNIGSYIVSSNKCKMLQGENITSVTNSVRTRISDGLCMRPISTRFLLDENDITNEVLNDIGTGVI